MKLKGSMQNKKVKKNAQKIEKDSKQNQGITLIALVVTIVVLLILAGITLTIIFGENGVINQANKARNAQNIAKYKDLFDTARFSVIAEKHGTVTVDEFISELEKEGIIKNTQVEKKEDGSAVITPEIGIDIKVIPINDGKDIEIQYPDATGNIGGRRYANAT